MSKSDYIINNSKENVINLDEKILSIINDFNGAYNYHSKLPDYRATPLEQLPNLAREFRIGGIWVKNEAKRFGVPAIKMLGASYAIYKQLQSDPGANAFCTATDGNHGRAVAWAARQLNRKVVVFVPEYTVASRVENIEAESAEVIKIRGDYDLTVKEAEKYALANHYQLIQDTAWSGYLEIPALITAGYYTQMKEIELEIKKFSNTFDLILVQTGVGSWPSAVAHYASNHPGFKKAKIICVEPFESDCFLESMKKNIRSATRKTQQTIMAGLNCGTPSLLAWKILQNEADAFISIDDSYALEAIRKYYYPISGDKIIEAGESGSAGLAGLMALLKETRFEGLRKHLNITSKSKVLLFNTEGITDPEFFKKNIR
jgi:diaminopropionate ammonia-lyase